MIYDINLIPKKKKKESSKAKFATIVLFFCSAALLLSFGLYLPYQQKNLLIGQALELQNELLSYSNTQETYITLSNQIDDLSRTNLMLTTLKSSRLNMTKIMNDIEKNIPKDIIINTMSLEAGMLTMEGTSPSYLEMARFMINVRDMENVSNVTFLSATIEETMEDETLEGSSNKDQLNKFAIYVSLNMTDVLSQLILEQVDTMNNEGTEAIQNETNQ